MKIIGTLQMVDGRIVITPTKPIEFKYDQNKNYSLEIEPISGHRTIQQNKLLWALIDEICMKEYGSISRADEKYCDLLEKADVKSARIYVKPDAFYDLRNTYKYIKLMGTDNGYFVAKVFFGSSQMSTKEMAALIKTTIEYAYEINCPNVKEYKDLLERNQ